MLRPSPTQISLSDHEVFQALQAIHIQRAMSLRLDSYRMNEEDEAGYYVDSSCTSPTSSSSAQYTTSEYERLACEVWKRYQDAKIYLDSFTSDSRDVASPDSSFALSEYPAPPRVRQGTRTVDRNERDDTEGAYENVTEIPDSTQTSSTPPMESSADTSPPGTIVLSPRSPNSTPRARRVSRVHRSGHHGIVPVLHVQVPFFYERASDMLLSDYMAEGAAIAHELTWQNGPPSYLRDTHSRLPLRRGQQSNWRRYMLGQFSKEEISKDTEAQPEKKWQEENTRSTRTHCHSKMNLALEVIDQNDEEGEDDDDGQ